jgi:uncharacterized protein YgiM (DUF1202 family)
MANTFDINQLPKSIVFSSKIQTLEEQLPAILDDFKKYYVFYNKNPEYDEYQKMFENIKSNIQTLDSTLSTITNDIESNTEDINQKLTAMNVLILREKEKNKRLKRKLGYAEEKSNGADEMIHNYKELYDINYLRNWGLFLGIVMSCIALSKVFKKTQTTQFRNV